MLLQFLRGYFYSNLYSNISPDLPIFEKMQGPDVNMSAKSKAIRRVHAQGNALTFFHRTVKFSNTIVDSVSVMKPEYCAYLNHRFQTDRWHNSWHKNPVEFDYVHAHLAKEDLSPITPQELECFLDQLKQFHRKHDLCNDRAHCLLADEDAAILQKQYEEFYKEKLPVQEKLNKLLAQEFYSVVGNIAKQGALIFLHSFLQTLLKNYLKPYLQTKIGEHASKTLWLVELSIAKEVKILESAATFALTFSLARVSLSFILESALAPALSKIGIDAELSNDIITQLSTIAAFVNNPTSVLELMFTGTAALAGQTCAYHAIRLLPKIKIEPSAIIQPENDTDIVKTKAFPSTLRKRF